MYDVRLMPFSEQIQVRKVFIAIVCYILYIVSICSVESRLRNHRNQETEKRVRLVLVCYNLARWEQYKIFLYYYNVPTVESFVGFSYISQTN